MHVDQALPHASDGATTSTMTKLFWVVLAAPLLSLLFTPRAARAGAPAEPPPTTLEAAQRPLLVTRPFEQRQLTPPKLTPVQPVPVPVPTPTPSSTPIPASTPKPSLPPDPCKRQDETSARTCTEQWVSEGTQQGELVELDKAPGSHALRAAFLKALIAKPAALHPNGVRLANAEIEGDFEVDPGQSAPLELYDVHFTGRVRFVKAELSGSLVLEGARIDGDLDLRDSTFAKRVSLAGATVSKNVLLDRSHFNGGLDMSGLTAQGTVQAFSTFYGCTIPGADGSAPTTSEKSQECNGHTSLKLSGARIGRDLILQGSTFPGVVAANFVGVDGNLVLEFLKFGKVADFSSGTAGKYLVLQLPVRPTALRIDQLRYAGISNGEKAYSPSHTWTALKTLCDAAKCSVDVYARLEQFFHDSGETTLANDVYIERMAQERDKPRAASGLEAFGSRIDKFFSLLNYYIIGYGRNPEWALGWSMAIVAFGTFIFWRESEMDDTDEGKPRPSYNAFWYSLDLFVPIARLQAADRWIPRRERWFAWAYLRVHVLLGWILIPLGLAAVSGLVN